jgi:hypothetical protein
MELAGEAAPYSIHLDSHEETGSLPITLEKLQNLNGDRPNISAVDPEEDLTPGEGNLSRESLGLLLSCQLAELHGGQIAIQGSAQSGHRYVLTLPLQLNNSPKTSNIS